MKKFLALAAVAAFVTAASAVDGTVVNYDISGAESWDDYGDSDNMVLVIDTAAMLGLPTGTQTEFHGIGWDVTIATVGGSWLSEAKMYFDDNIAPDGTGLFLTPGAGDNNAGTATYTSGGVVDLSDNGISDLILPDGMLRLEFYESYNDYVDSIDANYLQGSTLQFDLVPEPAGLVLLGLGAVALLRRR